MSIKEHPPLTLDVAPLGEGEGRQHVPVLLDATLHLLNPKMGENYLDLTAGYGGHARAFLYRTENYTSSVLVDRDAGAHQALVDLAEKGVRLIRSDFASAAEALVREGVVFNLVLVDLGVSSPQLQSSERGFSFLSNGPLDMRMDRQQELTAETVVNTASVGRLCDIIQRYGEEPAKIAKRLAEAIIRNRPIKDTQTLAELVKVTIRGKWTKTHPATRTFQAIRIAVNDELSQVERMLPLIPRLLAPGGRVGVISFHSLEDRLVKQFFVREAGKGLEAELEIMTKKPLDGKTHDVHNPRARSAKLRVAVKIQHKQ